MTGINKTLHKINKTLGLVPNRNLFINSINRINETILRLDADPKWEENEHPRGNDGKFAKSSSSGSKFSKEISDFRKSLGSAKVKGSSMGLTKYLITKTKLSEEEIKEALKEMMGNIDENYDYVGAAIAQLNSENKSKIANISKPPEKHVKKERIKASFELKQETIKSKPGIDEKKWHNETYAWSNASEEFMYAMAGCVPLAYVKSKTGNDSYYMPGHNYIHMRMDVDEHEAIQVWRHEYGHAIDCDGKKIPQSATYEMEIKKDDELLLNDNDLSKQLRTITNYNDPPPEIELTESQQDVYKQELRFFNDFTASLTKTRIGYGHSLAYYNQGFMYQSTEMFANYVTLTQGRLSNVWTKLLNKFAPNSCRAFDEIINKMAEKGKKVLNK